MTQCGKIPYTTPGEAHKAGGHIQKRRTIKKQAPADVYKCEFCKHWHLGRQILGKIRAKPKACG